RHCNSFGRFLCNSSRSRDVADVVLHGFTYYCRPMLRQRLAATDREHPLAEVMKNTRCHRYSRLSNPAHNGLVGGSSPPGPTMRCCRCRVLNGLAPKLSSVIPVLDKNLFTIRPQQVSGSPRAPCACDLPPSYSAAPRSARRGR